MILSDLPTILFWYSAMLLIGLIFLPLTASLFFRLFDRGYAFSRILGILLLTYAMWLLGSFKLLSFTQDALFILLFAGAAINGILLAKNAKNGQFSFWKIVQKRWKLFVFEEAIFIASLLFWIFIRGHEPSIHGLEKFMDFGFVNSILRSPYFPPLDMWLAKANNARYTGGFFINYYYFGHLTLAVLTKLTAIPSYITYNLMLALLFAMSTVGSFSLGLNLFSAKGSLKDIVSQMPKRTQKAKQTMKTALMERIERPFRYSAVVAGFISAFLVTLAGNLHTIYIFTTGYPNENPVPFWEILNFSLKINYWYPNATRFIPRTIHEFPSYSWVVADLHGHVFDIPYVLLALAALFALTIELFRGTLRRQISMSILLGLLISVMYMTNAWDGIIYLGLSGLLLASWYVIFRALNKKKQTKACKTPSWNTKTYISQFLGKNYLARAVTFFTLIAGGFFVFSLPFNAIFVPFVHGIGVVGGWEIGNFLGLIPSNEAVVRFGPFLFEKGNSLRSPFWMLMILWGFFYLNAAVLLFYAYKKTRSFKATFTLQTIQSNLPFLFVLLLIITSTGLITFPEFFYAKDIYPGHYRANTVFKLGYQAFIMLSLASGFIIVLTKRWARAMQGKKQHKRTRRNVLMLFTVQFILLIMVGIYPYFSIKAYYGIGANRTYESMDGSAWLSLRHRGDYDAIRWFNENIVCSRRKTGNQTTNSICPVILEAVGESYTDYARISAYTGLPAVLGWPVHEWLWRGSYDEPGKRIEEVRQIYEGSDKQAVKTLLDEYNVEYIIIGDLERDKYVNINEDLLISLSDLVFFSNGTNIYKLRD